MAEPQESFAGAAAVPLPERLLVTLDTASGGVLKLEIADTNNAPRELTNTERVDLARKFHGGVDALLERAFEAGVAALLDEDGAGRSRRERDDRDETEEEAGVRRILLEPLMAETFASAAARGEAIRKAILQSLIEDVASQAKRETEAPNTERAA